MALASLILAPASIYMMLARPCLPHMKPFCLGVGPFGDGVRDGVVDSYSDGLIDGVRRC